MQQTVECEQYAMQQIVQCQQNAMQQTVQFQEYAICNKLYSIKNMLYATDCILQKYGMQQTVH
jgi:hypothetical protein